MSERIAGQIGELQRYFDEKDMRDKINEKDFLLLTSQRLLSLKWKSFAGVPFIQLTCTAKGSRDICVARRCAKYVWPFINEPAGRMPAVILPDIALNTTNGFSVDENSNENSVI